MTVSRTVAAWAMAAALVCAPAMAHAQPVSQEPGDPAQAKPGLLKRVGIDQRLHQQVPLDLVFKDEAGRDVRLGEYFGKRPVILVLGYYECPMLCTQVLNGLVSALGVLTFDAGREFDVVAVSINPKESPALAAQKKQSYMERYKRPDTVAGWHFLTGTDASIQHLAEAVGFRYALDDEIQQYAHAAVIEVLTPRGVISHYFYGIEFSPRDIKFGLMEASEERIGTAVDSALLLCYHYDPATGKYGASVIGAVRVGAVATLLAFLSFLYISLKRERAAPRDAAL